MELTMWDKSRIMDQKQASKQHGPISHGPRLNLRIAIG